MTGAEMVVIRRRMEAMKRKATPTLRVVVVSGGLSEVQECFEDSHHVPMERRGLCHADGGRSSLTPVRVVVDVMSLLRAFCRQLQ